MRCVKCRDTRLDRFRSTSPLPGWTCPKCGGLWIPDGQAVGAVPPRGLAEIPGPVTDEDNRTGLCPSGHGILIRAQTHVDSGFYLERCSQCLGVWFDRGEWQKIAAAGLTSGLFEIWSESWQRRQRQQHAEEAHHSRLEAELGGDLIDRIESVAHELKDHPSRGLGVGHLLARLRGEAAD